MSGTTHQGKVRAENQDSVLAEAVGSVKCLAVADGMGGHLEGARASQVAVESLRSGLKAVPAGLDENGCRSLIDAVHQEVRKVAPEGEVAGTTLTVAVIAGQDVLIGHVGDSRAYRWSEGKLEQLTTDHTWAQYAADHRMETPYGQKLRQAVGVDAEVDVQTVKSYLLQGDLLLVCSDGLHKMVPEPKIGRALGRSRNPDQACRRLTQLALAAGGKDNIAVAVAMVWPPKRLIPAWLLAFLCVAAAVAVLALAAWASFVFIG